MEDFTTAYRVELEQFSGPMDLLLHLLKEDELEVETIPVARVCDRYLAYLQDLDRIDVDAAGEFLVMASVLMRIKSKSLLPSDEQGLDDDDDLDPRFELVRQLIQYRRFKRVAEILAERRESAARRFARGMHPELAVVPDDGPREVDVSDASIELLFTTFARLLKETHAGRGYVVTRDDTPMEVHLDRVEMLVPVGTSCDFRDLFPPGSSRAFVIGIFLALLELMKRGRIDVTQTDEFGDILVEGREARIAGPERLASATAPEAVPAEAGRVVEATVVEATLAGATADGAVVDSAPASDPAVPEEPDQAPSAG